MKHPTDLILPLAFAFTGLLSAWIDGKWNGVCWTGIGYLGIFVITSFLVRGRLGTKAQP